jgi:DNA-directed RNA polymerase subunit beta'
MRSVQVVSSEMEHVPYSIPKNYKILVKDGDTVEAGAVLAQRGDKQIIAQVDGIAIFEDHDIIISHETRDEREYDMPAAARLRVEEGQRVEVGTRLTDGALNPHEILEILGMEAVQQYMLEEIQQVYRTQGVTIHDKHIEVIIRQMFRRVRVTSSGDTYLLPGDMVDKLDFEKVNNEIMAEGGEPATAEPMLMGITKAALNTESFLSAASFQHTISVLSNAAIEGKRDDLHGLKESVIIGKLIPAGTGFRRRQEKREALTAATALAMKMAAGTGRPDIETEATDQTTPDETTEEAGALVDETATPVEGSE